MLRKWSAFVLLLLVTPMLALAQNSGKLAGVITDAESGDPLPGASVLISGTQLGTITDVDGSYFVIGIPVGTYNVQISFVGYQTQTFNDTEIRSNLTTTLDASLSPGVELDEIVVEYERPLIQKDAVGDPKIVSGEEIVNLPVRGAADVAGVQAGVVKKENSGTLNVRGGRGAEVTYYIDGVKVIGSTDIPQSAIAEQEMLIGNISARYGDAMSGIISITTKSGAPNFFGSLEAITSESLDAFGYNQGSFTLGGPIIKDKLSFFLAAEGGLRDSPTFRAGELRINDAVLDNLHQFPQSFLAEDADGNEVLLKIPGSLSATDDGSGNLIDPYIVADQDGHLVVNNQITFSDGTVVNVPEGVTEDDINFNPVLNAEYLTGDDFSIKKALRSSESRNAVLSGNLTLTPLDNVRFRLGGRYRYGWSQNSGSRDRVFAPEDFNESDNNLYNIYGTWTQYLSNSTFYQLQVDYTKTEGESWDPRFGKAYNDFLIYGDIDQPERAVLASYRNLGSYTDEFGHDVPQFIPRYIDGSNISNETVANLLTPPGGNLGSGYSKGQTTQLRFSASATTQIGLHQLEFGGEFEQRTGRAWSIGPRVLSRYVADGNPEQNYTRSDGSVVTINSFDDIPYDLLEDFVGNYYGYDLTGRNEVDSEKIKDFVDTDINKPLSSYNKAPYEPIYYGGYLQDKIEFRDIVLNLGLRVDVFDNNMRVLEDIYARRPIERAGAAGLATGNIRSDWAVYYNGDTVVGFRDLDGRFYDQNGQEVQAAEVVLNGKPNQTSDEIDETMFKDYEPQVTLMPRIGVSFPVTDQALFFASYGVVSQRPSENVFSTLSNFEGTGGLSNTGLEPQKVTEYELGFRQRLSEKSAFSISGFFRQIDNLIQNRDLIGAFPNTYTLSQNVDFGTVKGMEFDFDLRRTNGVQVNANYTLSFAQGTGSNSNTTSIITWIDETPPNFISPLDFDQRHRLNLNIDYRLGQGEGPTIGGAKVLENFGINILATAGSGFPYTSQADIFDVINSRAPRPVGGINAERMPWQSRVDIRLDRRFLLGGGKSLSAFLWVQNLFDQENVNGVWRATGLWNDDGFLSTTEGQLFLDSGVPVTETLYRHRTRSLGALGIPRLTRLGVRLDF